jgi:hypothetical protein
MEVAHGDGKGPYMVAKSVKLKKTFISLLLNDTRVRENNFPINM